MSFQHPVDQLTHLRVQFFKAWREFTSLLLLAKPPWWRLVRLDISSQHFKEQNSTRIDLSFESILPTMHFRSHVHISPTDSKAEVISKHTQIAEVSHFGIPTFIKENVLKLNVSMHNILTVQVLQSKQNILTKLHSLLHIKWPIKFRSFSLTCFLSWDFTI